jgi:hypothetical protein
MKSTERSGVERTPVKHGANQFSRLRGQRIINFVTDFKIGNETALFLARCLDGHVIIK